MIKKLTFEKISPENPIAGVGTAGNIWMVMNALLNIKDSEKLFVDMLKNKTINFEENEIFGTRNAWEYYFEQVQMKEEDFKELDFFDVNKNAKIFYEKHYSHNDKILKEGMRKFWDNFKLKNYLDEEINKYYENNIKNKETLGVQIRLTDMVSNHNVKKFNDYISKVNKILKKNKNIEQIFLATDDETIIKEFSEKVSRPVIYLKDIYRATKDKRDVNPYDRCDYIRPNHLFLLGKEVLLDIFILSKCDYILKSEISAVSQLAVLFAENTKKTYFMKSRVTILLEDIKGKVRTMKIKVKRIIKNEK